LSYYDRCFLTAFVHAHSWLQAEFRLVHKAWEVLRDTELRQQYDQRLQDEAIVANTASSNHLEIDLDDMEFVILTCCC